MSAIAPCPRTAVYSVSGLMSAAGGAWLMAQAWPQPALYKYAQTGEHRECFLRPPAASTIISSTVTMIKAALLLCTLALLVLATQAAVVR